MSTRQAVTTILVLVSVCVLASCPVWSSPLEGEFSVERTFDGQSFVYTSQQILERPAFRVYQIRYPSPVRTAVAANNTVPGELFLPRSAGSSAPVPAVICLHILGGDRNLMELVCSGLASRGIAAFMFRLPYYGERGESTGPRILLDNPALFVEAVQQAFSDIRRAVDMLASRPEIMGERISVMGISLGGIVALGASAEEPRLWRTLAVLAGGNLERIIFHAPETRGLRETILRLPTQDRENILRLVQRVDPVKLAPKLRDRAAAERVLLVNAELDEVIPRECTEELARALGMEDRVVWLKGVGHYSAISKLPEVLEQAVVFFAQDADNRPTPQVADQTKEPTPVDLISQLLQQASAVLLGEPDPGRGYQVVLSGWVKQGASQRETRFSIAFARGDGGKFRLDGHLPEVGKVAIGQHEFPWMVSREGKVFVGALSDTSSTVDKQTTVDSSQQGGSSADKSDLGEETADCSGDPLRFADRRLVDQVRMAAGVAAGVAIAPQLLEKFGIKVEGAKTAEGLEARLSVPQWKGTQVSVLFSAADRKPKKIQVAGDNWRAEISVELWAVDEPVEDRLFEPPAELACQKVPCDEIHRMFAAFFNFAVARLVER